MAEDLTVEENVDEDGATERSQITKAECMKVILRHAEEIYFELF